MPSSYHGFITKVLDDVCKAGPSSILDIGVGFGKWGLLFREYLDVFKGRYHREDWKVRIDGIEIFEPYIKDYHRYIYTNLYIGNAFKILDDCDHYDYIFIGDCLEHFTKPVARSMIKKMLAKTNNLLISIPLTNKWPQGKAFGNKYETHHSIWNEKDFSGCCWSEIHSPKKKKIGLFKYTR
jgi:hypothetical protein